MQSKTKTFLFFTAIPLLVGIIAGLLTRDSMETFSSLNKPPLPPPGILFPIVWTILYTLMGIASFLVYTSGKEKEEINSALTIYFLQLAVNFFWSIFFFNLEWYIFSFFWLVLLWVLIFYTIRLFYPISNTAAYLLIPYLFWVTFAGYLNLGIAALN